MPNDEDWDCKSFELDKMNSVIDEEISERKSRLCRLAAEMVNGDKYAAEVLEREIDDTAVNVAVKLGFPNRSSSFNFIRQNIKMEILNKILPTDRVINEMKQLAKGYAKKLSTIGATEITVTGSVGFASVSVKFDVKSLVSSSS